MPKNKEALIRYRIIDSCLRSTNKPYPSMDEITEVMQEKLGKSFCKSTIQKDIKAMKEDEALAYKAPIRYSKHRGGYYYEEELYSISKIPLNENDIDALEFATAILDQFKNIPIINNYSHAVEKIMEAMSVRHILEDNPDTDIIQFEEAPFVKGRDLLSRIITAIKKRKKIRFEYEKFSGGSKTHTLNPYLLKEYRNRWYLIGMIDEKKRIVTFGLDRMDHLEMLEEAIEWHLSFSPADYFNYAFGVTVFDKEPEVIRLKFNPLQAQYIKTQPLHSSQRIQKESKEGAWVELKVYPSKELLMQVLSYGSAVEVLSPKPFREEVKLALSESLKAYTVSV